MSRSRLLRSHSTDGLFRRTPSSSDLYDSLHRSSAWDYPNGVYDYDSDYSTQHGDRYQQSSLWNEEWQDTNFQPQPTKQNRVTWGAMPKYSSERNRLANQLANEESRYSRAHSPHRNSSESSYSIHGHSRQGHDLHRNDYDHSSLYGSQLYSGLYNSGSSNRNHSSGYYQTPSKPFSGYSLGTSRNSYTLPGRYSSFGYLRNPLLDIGYYPSYYGSLPRDQIRSILTSQASLQRPKRPKWRRSIIGLNRWSSHN